MNTPKEIERKWLCDKEKIPFDLALFPCKKIEQSYISFSPTIRLRSENGEKFILCFKAKPIGNSLVREEYETELTKEEYENLLRKTEGNVIEKTRYLVPEGNLTMEIDVFEGVFEGLCYMEIEFENESEALSYKNPDWVIKDVTSDKKYTNASLAKCGNLLGFNGNLYKKD